MALRTKGSSVRFDAPFRLTAFDELFPAGTYAVETEEEIIEGNERTVYVRVATRIRVRTGSMVQTLTIDPRDLQDAVHLPIDIGPTATGGADGPQ